MRRAQNSRRGPASPGREAGLLSLAGGVDPADDEVVGGGDLIEQHADLAAELAHTVDVILTDSDLAESPDVDGHGLTRSTEILDPSNDHAWVASVFSAPRRAGVWP